MSEQSKTELPNGKTLYRWTQEDGEWACIAYDHGPFCRRCVPMNEWLDAMLENVMDGFMEVKDDPERGMVFRVTESGKHHVGAILRDFEGDSR